MIVTELAQVSKYKFKVYIDHEFAFQLSAKEVQLYGIQEEHQVTDVLYYEILNETILPKAKLKAMDLLKASDRTEAELTSKLKTAGFPVSITQEALAYVKKFNYVNDYRYACNYIHYRKESKSKKLLQLELSRKGIEQSLIEQALEEEYQGNAEEEAIRREIKKKCRNVEELTYEKKMKLSASLYRKGYSASLIRSVLGDLSFYDSVE